MASGLTVPDAIRKLFDIDVATQSAFLKNKAMSMIRNGLIKIAPKSKLDDHRFPTYLANEQQLVVLFNALLLNAVFHDPKDVKKIFEDISYRQDCAKVVSAMLGNRNSLMGISLNNPASVEFTKALASDVDLYSHKLPNPFAVLPQLALGKNQNLLHALLVQSAALEPADNVLLAYIEGDIEKAAKLAELMDYDNGAINQIKLHLEKKLSEALEFDELLDQFKKM
ncbi:hypothetical protein ORJ00_07715 [Rheinheimera baltica]|uniref:hypothetical protein n=1 Tax=Rheinheimera baltica TaxID=67576 RepID=UPI00273E2430|nr:hypothetical protein [Rheinheimera baltica]MDP5142622.1 hypothetical protein [Rheinheimera baltica]